MITIKLLDARRGLNLKCRELFGNERIAEMIYSYLREGIEECEYAEPERKTGKWIYGKEGTFGNPYGHYKCSVCGEIKSWRSDYCSDCGAKMEGEE